MEGIEDLCYEERAVRVNILIKRVEYNNINRKLKKSNPDLEIRTLNLQWIDDQLNIT